MEYLAQSTRPPGQPKAKLYQKHAREVRDDAVASARGAVRFYTGDGEVFVATVEAAAIYHDLGKLDEKNQQILKAVSRSPLKIPHEDAGVAELLRLARQESAVLVAAHHAGLFSHDAEREKRQRAFRDVRL